MSVIDNVSAVPPEVFGDLAKFIGVLKAIGVLAIAYFAYMVVMAVLNYKKLKRLGVVESKIDSLEKKLDKLIRKKKG